jgi:hypothetical protein
MVLVVGAVAASLVLGACGGVVGSFVSTRQALSAAGYSDVSVGVAGNDDNVKISARVDQTISAGEFHEIAAIVWRDVHQRFGALDITLHAAGQTVRQSVSLAELQRQLGPRNPSYNKSSLRTEIITTGVAVLAAIAAVVILLVVAVVLVRRRRRGGRSGSRGQPDPTGSGRGPGHPWPPGGGGPPEGRWRPDRGGGRAAEPSWGTPVPVPAPTPGSEGRVTEPDSWPPPPGSEPPAWS